MNSLLDAAVQLLQLAALVALMALNLGLGKRLKAIEDKLSR
jgi:hypothetical protein